MKGKIYFIAAAVALCAVLFVSCRTLPVGEAEVGATVEVEVEITNEIPVNPSPEPVPQPVPEPEPQAAPEPEVQQEEDAMLPPGAETPGAGTPPGAELPPGTEPVPEPAPMPMPQPEPQPVMEEKIGKTGPHGGIIFKGENGYLETGIPVDTVSSYIEALVYCANLNPDNPTEYRIPYIGELSAIYSQLIETGLYHPGVEYAWSSSEYITGTTQKAMNLETGFTGSFYTDSTFVGVIPVTEMAN
ncbi:MAG: hypothetical protein IJM73_06530 [Spirochaetales bacterium]|nr:hypothetical protein [Spirochaetales bacterium]